MVAGRTHGGNQMIKRPLVGVAIAAATIIGLGGTALAGEWGPGNGDTPIKSRQDCTEEGCPAPAGPANSVCAFNGRDQPDTGDNPEDHGGEPGDDEQWGMTPAGGKVQSGGQFVAMFANLGFVAGAVQSGEFGGFGIECNPNSGFEE